jgi:hypothetical protein
LITEILKFFSKRNPIFDQKLQFVYPHASMKEKPSALKREHPGLKNREISLLFSIRMG